MYSPRPCRVSHTTMPKRNKKSLKREVIIINANNNKKKKNKQNKKKKSKSRRQGSALMQGGGNSHARMMLDPCNATLTPGFYGDSVGYLTKVPKFLAISEKFNTASCGYIIWFPDYHNQGGYDSSSGRYANLFQYFSATIGGAPTSLSFGNTDPAGVTNTATSSPDPAYSFVNSQTCMDARTIGACLSASYTGQLQTSSGLIYPLMNVPINYFLQSSSGTTHTTAQPSVADMLNYAGNGQRCLQKVEVKWRPGLDSAEFRNTSAHFVTCQNNLNPSINPNITPQIFGIGLAFVATPAPTNFLIRTEKNIEWRPEITSGFQQPTITGSEDPHKVATTVNRLDRVRPDWQWRDVVDAGISVVRMANKVLGGSGMNGPPRIDYGF